MVCFARVRFWKFTVCVAACAKHSPVYLLIQEGCLAVGNAVSYTGDRGKLLPTYSPYVACWGSGFHCSDFGILVRQQCFNEQIPVTLLLFYLGN